MQTPSERSLGPAGWAVYLGCSWTWCIGMFLPALLIRDLGFWGYVVFAVPNVVGAAAMGWVLRSPESSRKLVEDHKAAAVLFSRVTILFHLFWIAWLASWASNHTNWPIWLWIALIAVPVVGRYLLAQVLPDDNRKTQLIAFGTWAVSAALLVSLALSDSVSPSPGAILRQVPLTADVYWLLPASVFGFLFCPYLDLTFLRARAESKTKRDSQFAFGAGFGIFFFSMIVLTVLYSGPIASITNRDSDAIVDIASWAGILLALHFLLQALFTLQVHLQELGWELPPTKGPYGWFDVWLPITIASGIIIGQSSDIPLLLVEKFNMTGGELIYRLFLTFYGLIFPTYVYLNIWDIRRRSLRRQTKRSLQVTVAAIILASPFFFMGFFVRDERYIPAGVAILLLAKLFTGRDDKPAPIAQPA